MPFGLIGPGAARTGVGVIGLWDGLAGAVRMTFTAAMAEETKILFLDVRLSSISVRFGIWECVRDM